MTNILLVTSSPRGDASHSSHVARALVDRLKANHPGAKVTIRDLGAKPLPHLDESYLGALFAPENRRDAAQRDAIARADALIAELEAADTVVIASAMINFGVTSTLKTWLDYVARSGRTFRYTAAGTPEGLLKGKKTYLVEAKGGIYSNEPMKAIDFQEPYLKHMLGFIGLTDIEIIAVEGVIFGEDAAKAAVAGAMSKLPALAARAAA